MITPTQVRKLYADANGEEAANDVDAIAIEATIVYVNKNEYEYLELPSTANGYEADAVRHNNRTLDRLILHTLDVLRLAYDGEFPNLHAEGASGPGPTQEFEYCNAAEMHVKSNPDHRVIVEYTTHNGFTSLEARCDTEFITDGINPSESHWWDHVA
jgi:hypothetical protein